MEYLRSGSGVGYSTLSPVVDECVGAYGCFLVVDTCLARCWAGSRAWGRAESPLNFVGISLFQHSRGASKKC